MIEWKPVYEHDGLPGAAIKNLEFGASGVDDAYQPLGAALSSFLNMLSSWCKSDSWQPGTRARLYEFLACCFAKASRNLPSARRIECV